MLLVVLDLQMLEDQEVLVEELELMVVTHPQEVQVMQEAMIPLKEILEVTILVLEKDQVEEVLVQQELLYQVLKTPHVKVVVVLEKHH